MYFLGAGQDPRTVDKYPGQLSGGQATARGEARSLCNAAEDHAVRRNDLGPRPGDDQGSADVMIELAEGRQ